MALTNVTYLPRNFDDCEKQKKVLARKNKWKIWTERKRPNAVQSFETSVPEKKDYLKDLLQSPIFSNHETIIKFASDCCTDDSVSKILLFKSWIEPVWEDKHNLHGGRFFLGCSDVQKAKEIFLHVISIQLKQNFFLDDSFVCGVALSIKENDFSVQIWHTRFRNKFSFSSILQQIKTRFPFERIGHHYHSREKKSPEKHLRTTQDLSNKSKNSRARIQLFPMKTNVEANVQTQETIKTESESLTVKSESLRLESEVTETNAPQEHNQSSGDFQKITSDLVLTSSKLNVLSDIVEEVEPWKQKRDVVDYKVGLATGTSTFRKPIKERTWSQTVLVMVMIVLFVASSCVGVSHIDQSGISLTNLYY